MADSQADSIHSPIIMKVDGPEESENNDNEANNEDANNEVGHSVCSPSVRSFLQSSRFGNPFAPKVTSTNFLGSTSSGNKSVLRPSQLSQVSSSIRPFSLNPSKLNPFLNVSTSEDLEPDETTKPLADGVNGETPKFVPLITSSADKPKVESNSAQVSAIPVKSPSSTNFVFGQNLQERVINDAHCSVSSNNSFISVDESKPSTSISTNGNTSSPKEEMLFSSAIKETPMYETNTPSKSLSESAREYEELRNNKRKYEEVETKTGEEDETNVMQISCKLFAYDKGVGNWQERGRGILRLNDLLVKDETDCFTQSRLVFRNSGVHKVILNTKIWAEMTVEQASAKSIRFTAIDTAGEIKVFLVMASPEETKQLFKCVEERRTSEQKRQHIKKQHSKTPSSEKDVEESHVSTTTSQEDIYQEEEETSVDATDDTTNGNSTDQSICSN